MIMTAEYTVGEGIVDPSMMSLSFGRKLCIGIMQTAVNAE